MIPAQEGAAGPPEAGAATGARLISRDAARRIFEKTKNRQFDVPRELAPHQGALYDTLSRVLRKATRKLARPPEASLEQGRSVGKAFSAFRETIADCAQTRHPPPLMSPKYVEEMERWIDAYAKPFLGLGRPMSDFQLFVYPPLLAYFRLAFGREPSASGGPTHRFLSECISAVRDSLQDHEARRVWVVPSFEALKKQLSNYLSDVYREPAELEVSRLFKLSVAKVRPRCREPAACRTRPGK
ncbi:hypothetical protein [Falsiroseomonas sp. E2-1-a4]|uniref:hypothetical protein n=1 Tax=Falsiroseomonas sp. E2-1-a4 TaxID=3239299 RepID=UPI003F2AF367